MRLLEMKAVGHLAALHQISSEVQHVESSPRWCCGDTGRALTSQMPAADRSMKYVPRGKKKKISFVSSA